jgi:hypothetical protein
VAGRLKTGFGRLCGDERGIALPTAMLVTVIGLALASVPIMASVNTQRNDQRDQATESALAAADSGANIAVARQSKMSSLLSTSKPCVKLNTTTKALEAVAVEGTGWCPSFTSTAVGSASYTYRVKPAYTASTAAITVVAAGTATAGARSTTRRLMVTATGSSGAPFVFGTEAVVGIDKVTMTNGTIYGEVGSNGNIEWPNGDAHILECTKTRVGAPSGSFVKQSWQVTPCGGTVVQEKRTYPNVVVPATNSNSRMFTAGGDTYTYSNGALAGCGAASWQASWCPTTKVMYLTSDARVTLSGTEPYVLCQLRLDNDAHIIMPAGAQIQIIFDSPENCNLPSGSIQFQLENGASLESASFSPGTGNYSVPGLFFVGSTGTGSNFRETRIEMDGGTSANNMVIYAPRTAINIDNGARFGGAILGKTVTMSGGTHVEPEGTGTFNPDGNLPVESTGGSAAFARAAYVECSASTTLDTTGC